MAKSLSEKIQDFDSGKSDVVEITDADMPAVNALADELRKSNAFGSLFVNQKQLKRIRELANSRNANRNKVLRK